MTIFVLLILPLKSISNARDEEYHIGKSAVKADIKMKHTYQSSLTK